jgi:hypothetical protein
MFAGPVRVVNGVNIKGDFPGLHERICRWQRALFCVNLISVRFDAAGGAAAAVWGISFPLTKIAIMSRSVILCRVAAAINQMQRKKRT